MTRLPFAARGDAFESIEVLAAILEEGQTLQGQFMLTLQLKNEQEASLYRPGIGQVSLLFPSAA